MTELQIAFIVTASLAGLLLLFIVFYKPIKRALLARNFVRNYGRMIYKVALDYDYYLINQFGLAKEGDSITTINHILFGQKYIYVIKDCYYRGAISAKENDASWIHYVNKNKKRYIDNPLRVNASNLHKLFLITRIEKNMLISIVVVNDDCHIEPFERKSQSNFLVTKSHFRKLIQALEQRPVENIDDQALDRAVKDIAHLNLNRHK
jgi:hypothetical protein